MGIIRYLLLVLPVHRRPVDKYYADHATDKGKRKKAFEKLSGFQFETLDPVLQADLAQTWSWPPWLCNDILGFVLIGSDHGNALVGEVLLKRKYFPRGSRKKLADASASVNAQFLEYAETPRYSVHSSQREAYVEAVSRVVEAANNIVRRRIRTASVWTPTYSLACIDWAEADRQARLSLRGTELC